MPRNSNDHHPFPNWPKLSDTRLIHVAVELKKTWNLKNSQTFLFKFPKESNITKFSNYEDVSIYVMELCQVNELYDDTWMLNTKKKRKKELRIVKSGRENEELCVLGERQKCILFLCNSNISSINIDVCEFRVWLVDFPLNALWYLCPQLK